MRPDLGNGLIGHWIVCEEPNQVIQDVSGKQNHCQIQGEVKRTTEDKGLCIELNGQGYISCQEQHLKAESPFTITGWFKAYNNNGLWGKWGFPDKRSFAVTLEGKRHVRFSISASGKQEDVVSIRSRRRVQKGTWHFVAAVHTGHEIRLYLDGRREAQRKVPVEGVHQSLEPLKIGSTGIRGHFKGRIRDVRYYERALSDIEIAVAQGNGYFVRAHGTLTEPHENARLVLVADRSLPSSKLTINIKKNKKSYGQYIKKLDPYVTHIALILKHDSPSGFYNAHIAVSDSRTGNTLFQHQEEVLIRKATLPKDILYFSFYTPKYPELTKWHIDCLERSPFTSMNSALAGAYSEEPIRYNHLEPVVPLVKQTKKHVWPMVFFNRLIGSSESSRFARRNSYWDDRHISETVFGRIKLMDLYDEQGCLSAFYDLYRTGLTIAKETGAPGLFVDAEPYNCHNARKIANLGLVHLKSKKAVIQRLMEIGEKLGRITDSVYPDASVYFYSTDFTIRHPGDLLEIVGNKLGLSNRRNYYQSLSYIVLGMLEYAKRNAARFTVIDGEVGEYTYPNIGYLKTKLMSDSLAAWSIRDEYPSHFKIANRISPFLSYEHLSKTSWIRNRLLPHERRNDLHVRRIADFINLFSYLFTSADFTWVYGAGAAGEPTGFDLFTPHIASKYNSVLKAAIEAARAEMDAVR